MDGVKQILSQILMWSTWSKTYENMVRKDLGWLREELKKDG